MLDDEERVVYGVVSAAYAPIAHARLAEGMELVEPSSAMVRGTTLRIRDGRSHSFVARTPRQAGGRDKVSIHIVGTNSRAGETAFGIGTYIYRTICRNGLIGLVQDERFRTEHRGADYTATSGTLTFNPGDAAKSISVPILDDAIDDGVETMTLTLSNATNARIADGTATGTIENADPLQRAWIARFGRTVASDVVDGITERLSNPRGGSEVWIAGVTLRQHGATWTEAASEDTELGDALEGEHTLDSREVSARELLLRSAFRLESESDGPDGTAWTAWGRFSNASFEGETDDITLSGDVTTGLVGADVGTGEWTAGVALSSAKGDGPWHMGESDGNAACDRGTVESALTSVHPYAELHLSDDVALWAIGGYGSGNMTIGQNGCDSYTTDVDMTMAAAGVRGQVLAAAAGDALDMAVRTDALWLRTTSDKVEGLEAAEADVTRLRLMVDAGRSFTTTGGATLTPTIEAGIRHDAGDAEQGVGCEVGGGLAYQDRNVTIEGKIRTLVAHDDSAYREWGASAAIRIDPGSDGRGLSLIHHGCRTHVR